MAGRTFPARYEAYLEHCQSRACDTDMAPIWTSRTKGSPMGHYVCKPACGRGNAVTEGGMSCPVSGWGQFLVHIEKNKIGSPSLTLMKNKL